MAWGTCKICGEKIVWARMPAGNWLPMDASCGERHQCVGQVRTGTPRTWKWPHEEDMCRKTRCPTCGDDVYFVRHNGGCVWFDSLGHPWPKHPCFDDEPAAAVLRATLRLHAAQGDVTFGMVVAATAEHSGDHRYVIRCADGSTIDNSFEGGWEIETVAGAIVQVTRTGESIRIRRVSVDKARPASVCLRIFAADPEKSLSWFRDVLGFELASGFVPTRDARYVLRSVNAFGIMLAVADQSGAADKIEVGIEYYTLEALATRVATLEQSGVAYEVTGSPDADDVAVRYRSPDGMHVVARVRAALAKAPA